jgi:glucuronate isomerase
MAFLDDDFLLHGASARRLYHEHAASQPILDYHSHLLPGDLARDRRFDTLFDIWLEGDHYKWRAMRANGIAERFCTGDAAPYEKFLAWASTVPHCVRNPLYHWTHLELRRYFGIDELLDVASAPRVWACAHEWLQDESLSACGILRRFDVRVLCTTDDPADPLEHHEAIRRRAQGLRVYPTFRPDAALRVDAPAEFATWVQRLGAQADVHVTSLPLFLDALSHRHDAFHAAGARLSDHGLPYCHATPCAEGEASRIFDRAMSGDAATPDEHERFASFMMRFFGHLDARKGWTKQLHLGARRNVSTRMMTALGRDAGFDAIGDWPQVGALAAYLDRLDHEGALPRTIVYNSNPADNCAMATMIGSFQDGEMAGKIQFGSAWWFLDQKHGIGAQLDALSDTGLLSRFVGMVTDSRSFMSFPRHEYFRRILCNLLGTEMDRGELPNDFSFMGSVVEAVCYGNAERYLRLETPDAECPSAAAGPSPGPRSGQADC